MHSSPPFPHVQHTQDECSNEPLKPKLEHWGSMLTIALYVFVVMIAAAVLASIK